MSLNHLTNADIDIKCKTLELGGGSALSGYKEEDVVLVNVSSPGTALTNLPVKITKVGRQITMSWDAFSEDTTGGAVSFYTFTLPSNLQPVALTNNIVRVDNVGTCEFGYATLSGTTMAIVRECGGSQFGQGAGTGYRDATITYQGLNQD